MRSLVELLEQTAIWRGRDGRVYYVRELDTEYLDNVIAYLGRHADELLARRRRHLQELGPATTLHHVAELESDDALTWLRDRPLYRELLAERRRRGAIDGEVVDVEALVERRVRQLEAEHDAVTAAADVAAAPPVSAANDRTLTDLSLLLARYRDAIQRLGEL